MERPSRTSIFGRRWAVIWVIQGGMLACADLPTLAPGVCGNGVIDPGEDCDRLARPELGSNLACGAAGNDPRACRYLCSDGADCPMGWACGDDFVCRYPSGTFESPVRVQIPRASQVEIGDLDGDGRADLFMRRAGSLSVWRGQSDGRFVVAFTSEVPNYRGDAVFRDFDGDGRADVMIPIASRNLDADARVGVEILRGTTEGMLEPRVFPRGPLPFAVSGLVPVEVEPETHAAVLMAYHENDEPGQIGLWFDEAACSVESKRARWLGVEGRLRGSPVSFASPRGAPLQGLVAFTLTEDVVVVTSTISCSVEGCSTTGLGKGCVWIPREQGRISLPELSAGTGGTIAADRNGDGIMDLIIPLQGRRIAVAFGDVDGSFSSTRGPWSAEVDSTFDVLKEAPLDLGVPQACTDFEPPVLVAADFDKDGVSDLVTPNGVFVSTEGGGLEITYLRQRGDGWKDAVVGDFNRDGALDIVASTRIRGRSCQVGNNLDYLVGDGTGRFGTSTLASIGVPRFLSSGDFDGDRVSDVAVFEDASTDGSLMVWYGSGSGQFAERVRTGPFIGVDQVLPLVFREGDAFNSDRSRTDLAILSRQPDALTLLLGSSSRRFSASLMFPSASEMGPLLLGFERLSLGVAPEVAWLAGTAGHLWVSDFEFDQTSRFQTAFPAGLDGFRLECATWAGRRDIQGRAVFVGVDQFVHDEERTLTEDPYSERCRDPETSNLVVLGYPEGSEFLEAARISTRQPACSRHLQWADLDGNERPEVLLAFEPGAAGPGRCGDARIQLHWNVALEQDAGSESTVPTELLGADQAMVATGQFDCRPDTEVVVHLGGGAVEIHRSLPGQRLVSSASFAADNGARRLLVGDVNGDGLADVVLVYEEYVQVYLSIPQDRATPSESCIGGGE